MGSGDHVWLMTSPREMCESWPSKERISHKNRRIFHQFDGQRPCKIGCVLRRSWVHKIRRIRRAQLRNHEEWHTLIGLFQGMFECNMLTFNPGWDQSTQEVNPFEDVSEIKVKAAGHEVSQGTVEDTGIGSFVVIDPAGNPILIDQHR
jgi:hypothetical protein